MKVSRKLNEMEGGLIQLWNKNFYSLKPDNLAVFSHFTISFLLYKAIVLTAYKLEDQFINSLLISIVKAPWVLF